MRVNEGPSIRDSVVAKAPGEREREKDDDASVLAQSSSRERARADKDPDVPASQGAAWCRLERATPGSRERKTVAVLAGGRPFGSRKSFARHGAGGGNGLGHGRRSEGSRRNESRGIGGGDGGSEERSITPSLGRLTKLQRMRGGCPKRYACREARVSPVSRIGRSKPPGARFTVPRAAMFEER